MNLTIFNKTHSIGTTDSWGDAEFFFSFAAPEKVAVSFN